MKRILVLLASALLVVPASAIAAGSGSLEGRVVSAGGANTPKAVWAANSAAPDTPQRAPIGEGGSFHLAAVPAGSVELAVETAEGLYLVETPITVAPGSTRQVQLTLRGRQDSSAPADDTDKKKRRGGMWADPMTATFLVVGTALATGLIISLGDDASNPPAASPSNP